jgi:hypothetical protein
MKYEETVQAINQVLAQYETKLTVRQIYYRLVSPPFQLFENTQGNYKAFDRILTKARERGDVDWRRIEDRARVELGGEPELTFTGPDDYFDWLFKMSEEYYTRRLWDDQPKYVEVWVEKDALSTLFESAAKPYRVVVFPSRGYSSFTKVMEALERFPDGKDIVILHFADHDPSGLDMSRDLTERFRAYAEMAGFDGTIEVSRRALTIEQVRRYNIPPNPTKRADARTPAYVTKYGNACWELDALPPDELQRIVEEAISEHIDFEAWNEGLNRIERERLAIGKVIRGAGDELERVKSLLNNRTKSELGLIEHV